MNSVVKSESLLDWPSSPCRHSGSRKALQGAGLFSASLGGKHGSGQWSTGSCSQHRLGGSVSISGDENTPREPAAPITPNLMDLTSLWGSPWSDQPQKLRGFWSCISSGTWSPALAPNQERPAAHLPSQHTLMPVFYQAARSTKDATRGKPLASKRDAPSRGCQALLALVSVSFPGLQTVIVWVFTSRKTTATLHSTFNHRDLRSRLSPVGSSANPKHVFSKSWILLWASWQATMTALSQYQTSFISFGHSLHLWVCVQSTALVTRYKQGTPRDVMKPTVRGQVSDPTQRWQLITAKWLTEWKEFWRSKMNKWKG